MINFYYDILQLIYINFGYDIIYKYIFDFFTVGLVVSIGRYFINLIKGVFRK